MRVMWLTPEDTKYTSVLYWSSESIVLLQNGTTDYYVWPLPPYISGQIHSKRKESEREKKERRQT